MKKLLFVTITLMSFSALAQRFEIGRGSKSFSVTSATSSKELNFEIPMYRIDEKLVVESVLCRAPQCSSESGDGSSGNWYGYFNVRASEKAAALAKAIKGIGPAISDKIVDNNLLMNKPNSWREFSLTIRKIERQLEARGYNVKFAGQVLEVYGYDNMINLGYGSAQICRYVESMCNQYSVQEFRTLSHHLSRRIVVDVKNQSLQSFETDTVTISVGTEPNDVRVSSTGSNEYLGTIYNRGQTLELEAKRILRPISVTEVSSSLVRDAENNFTWTLVLPAKYSLEDKGAGVEVTYEICRQGVIINCSSIVGGPWKESLTNNSISRIIFTKTLIPGKTYFIRARLNKVNSQYYSSSLSDYISSPSIRF
jgi:hypothetical protein